LLKLFARAVLILIGAALGLLCLFLAVLGVARLHSWSETGRMAPPNYPGLERYDVISFAADPLRAAMEIGGNTLLVVIGLCGLAATIMTFWRGLDWIQNWPAFLPLTISVVFWGAVAATLVGRIDWLLPESVLLGALAIGIEWVRLRHEGRPITARVSQVVVSSNRVGSERVHKGVGIRIAVAALIVLLAVLKLITSAGQH
jgi:hypothetical protein